MTAASPIVLEPAAQQVADAFSKPPFLWDMAPADARKILYAVAQWITRNGGVEGP